MRASDIQYKQVGDKHLIVSGDDKVCEIVRMECGFFYLWDKEFATRGAIQSWVLRRIADIIDEQNREWAEYIDKDFARMKKSHQPAQANQQMSEDKEFKDLVDAAFNLAKAQEEYKRAYKRDIEKRCAASVIRQFGHDEPIGKVDPSSPYHKVFVKVLDLTAGVKERLRDLRSKYESDRVSRYMDVRIMGQSDLDRNKLSAIEECLKKAQELNEEIWNLSNA